MVTWRYALIGLVPLAFLSVACGGDDDNGTSTEIDATLEDFKFSPTEWTVAAGEEISIELDEQRLGSARVRHPSAGGADIQ